MDENKKRSRREWVKTAAIVFLSIMLVLTFFSNTFMNYSLPEVAGQNAMSGTITAKIRETGVVQSGDPYNVMVKQVRKVESIEVRVGDQVQKGDTLLILTNEESDEIKNAQKELERAKDAYDQALLNAEITAQIVNQSKGNVSAEAFRNQITAKQNEITAAQKEIDVAQAEVDAAQLEVDAAKKELEEVQSHYKDVQTQITVMSSSIDRSEEAAALTSAKTALSSAQGELSQAEYKLDALRARVSAGDSVSAGDITAAENAVTAAEAKVASCESNKDQAQTNYNNKKTEIDASVANLSSQNDIVSSWVRDKENIVTEKQAVVTEKTAVRTQKEATKAEKEKELSELTGNISKVLNLESLYKAIEEAQENYDKVAEQSVDSVVTAGVAGTITAINVTSGKDTNTIDPVVVIQPEGKGYFISISEDNDKVKRLSVGDTADLVNSWRYDDVSIVLSSIKPDTKEPGQKKLLTFDVSGSVTPGQSLSFSVGQKSATYDAIVPNSAIREDNNGKFVLVVETKSSPLGNRYYATRMDVQVLASDDTQSAVSGLYGYEFVITTTTKPVEAGSLVRLANN